MIVSSFELWCYLQTQHVTIYLIHEAGMLCLFLMNKKLLTRVSAGLRYLQSESLDLRKTAEVLTFSRIISNSFVDRQTLSSTPRLNT